MTRLTSIVFENIFVIIRRNRLIS